jgi:hypothetical protein
MEVNGEFSLCVINQAIKHYVMKTSGKWRYSSTILDLGTRWRLVVGITLRPFYPRGKGPRYTLDRRLGGPQRRSGRCGVQKNLAPAGIRIPAAQLVGRCYTNWTISVSYNEFILTLSYLPLHTEHHDFLFFFYSQYMITTQQHISFDKHV